jgi:hypothetical protein
LWPLRRHVAAAIGRSEKQALTTFRQLERDSSAVVDDEAGWRLG